jgi:hypothetical protein
MIELHWAFAWFIVCVFTTLGYIAGGVLASSKDDRDFGFEHIPEDFK